MMSLGMGVVCRLLEIDLAIVHATRLRPPIYKKSSMSHHTVQCDEVLLQAHISNLDY